MNIFSISIFSIIFCIIFPWSASGAGLCCQLSSGAQESILGSALPGMQKPSLLFSYSYTLMDKFREGSDKKSLQEVKDGGRYMSVPTEMEMTKYTLSAAYDFNERFSVLAAVPYIRNTMDMSMLMKMEMGTQWTDFAMSPVEDIGDITLMGLYHYYPKGPTDAASDIISLGIGIKTPTGSSTKKGSSGKFIHAHMQPGTGSWDPLLSLIYTKNISLFLIQTDLTYQLTTRNSDGYEFGDSLTANLLGKYSLSQYVQIAGALTYLHVNKADDSDGKYTNMKSLMDDPANTGGDSLWFSPEVQIRPLKKTNIDFKIQLPVWEHVNGIQLVSSYRVLVAVGYTFN